MKTRFTFICSLFSAYLIAQPIYDSVHLAEVGDAYLTSSVTNILSSINYDSSGAGVYWDMSALGVQTQDSSYFSSPVGSSYKGSDGLIKSGFYATCIQDCIENGGNIISCSSDKCNSIWDTLTNISTSSIEPVDLGLIKIGGTENFYKKTGNSYRQTAIGLDLEVQNIPVIVTPQFKDDDIVYQFPLQYGDSTQDDSRYKIDLKSISFGAIDVVVKHGQTRKSYVEGWGSLKTPYDTFPDVLKLKSVVVSFDTIEAFGDTFNLDSVVTVEYSWLSQAYGIPVLQISGIEVLGQITAPTIEYIDTARCIDPFALFSFNPVNPKIDGASASSPVNFLNFTTNADSFYWDFGDGNFSEVEAPTHSYTNPGSYEVTLEACNTICDTFNCDFFSITVTVEDTNLLVADFTTPFIACQNSSLAFTNNSSKDTAVLWDFGDGTMSTLRSPEHTYELAGEYVVQLTVWGKGEVDSTQDTLVVEGVEIALSDTALCIGDTIGMEPIGINQAFLYTWSPDQAISCTNCRETEVSPTTTTTYTLDYVGLCGALSDTIRVYVFTSDTALSDDLLPADTTVCSGTDLVIEPLVDDVHVLRYQWNSVADTTICTACRQQRVSNSSDVEYILEVEGFCGTTFNDTVWVSTDTNKTMALFEIPILVEDGSIVIKNLSENADSFYWDFGDGNSLKSDTTLHQYDQAGAYTIQLVAYGDCNTDTFVNSVAIIIGVEEFLLNHFKIYPNPVKDQLTLTFESQDQQPFNLEIFNLLGEVIYQKQLSVTNGFNEFVVPVNKIQVAGTYLLKLHDKEGHSSSRSFIIQ